LFFFFGPLLCASAGGFYHFIKHHRNSVSLQVGTLFLIISGALVTLMTSMQGALKAVFQNIFIKNGSQSAQIAREMALKSGDALQLGADIAWDLFVFLSVIFLSLAALNHPRLGWMFALPGILIGLVGLGFNLCTFPHNPGTAGLIDTGPLVGLWFTAVSIRVLFSFKWLEHK
jgi:drug/metabolite transporter superfamily protein YnfA